MPDHRPSRQLLRNSHVNGASFSRLSNVSVTFDRQISVLGNLDCVKVVDEAGNTVRNSINFSVASGNPNVVNIAFRNYTLADGKKYTIVIPAGAIGVKSDEGRTNSELRFSYVGRPNTPVKPLSISPADGNEVPRINLSSNPVQVNFDTNLSVCENPDNETRIAPYMVDGDEQTRLCALNAEVNGSNVVIYPVNEQRLAQDKDYRVVINAGTFADLSGANPNGRDRGKLQGKLYSRPALRQQGDLLRQLQCRAFAHEVDVLRGRRQHSEFRGRFLGLHRRRHSLVFRARLK